MRCGPPRLGYAFQSRFVVVLCETMWSSRRHVRNASAVRTAWNLKNSRHPVECPPDLA
jgi:hypothetical protein